MLREADFHADLVPFLRGQFPKNQIASAAKDGTVIVETDGSGVQFPSGAEDWRYDNQDGTLIINLSGYETY